MEEKKYKLANGIEITESELKQRQRNGGIKSAKGRMERKLLKQVAEEKLNKIVQKMTFQEVAIDSLIEYCQSEDAKPEIILKVLEFLRDTSGQKPTEKQIIDGSVGIKKIFITQKEKQETDNHINEVIKGDA